MGRRGLPRPRTGEHIFAAVRDQQRRGGKGRRIPHRQLGRAAAAYAAVAADNAPDAAAAGGSAAVGAAAAAAGADVDFVVERRCRESLAVTAAVRTLRALAALAR